MIDTSKPTKIEIFCDVDSDYIVEQVNSFKESHKVNRLEYSMSADNGYVWHSIMVIYE